MTISNIMKVVDQLKQWLSTSDPQKKFKLTFYCGRDIVTNAYTKRQK